MSSPRPAPSVVALVVANLAIALLVAMRGWGYYETLLVYWLEAVIIGGFNVLRLLVVGLFGEQPLGAWLSQRVDFSSVFSRLFYVLLGTGFFVFKYGGFALVVGIFVVALPSAFAPAGEPGGAHVMRGLHAAGPGVLLAAGLLVLSHGYSFVRHFIQGREYAHLSIFGLIFWPYARMSLVALVLGLGFVVATLDRGVAGTTGFAIVMVVLKTIADGITHVIEHRWLAGRARPASQGRS